MAKLDTTNKWLTAIQSIVVIVGVGFTAWQIYLAQEALSAQQEATSAQYVLYVEQQINTGKFQEINLAVDDGSSTTRVIRLRDGGSGGPFSYDDVSNYISQFDDVSLLVKYKVITFDMAYNDFSYDVEKDWCNNDIRTNLIISAQNGDTSTSSSTNPYYGDFEFLATRFLANDRENCAWVDTQ